MFSGPGSGVGPSTFTNLPNAFSISTSKFSETSLFSFARGGVGRGGDFTALPSKLIMYDVCWSTGEPLFDSVRSRAGGRDFISFALSQEIKGTVDEEMTGAIINTPHRGGVRFVSMQ